MAQGESLAVAFSHAGILPPSFCGQVAAAEKNGDLIPVLKRLGEWYAQLVEYEATRLGITGYAKNLPDGRVEVLAEGDESILRQFIERLREGPAFARVDEVTFRWEAPTRAHTGFEAVI